MPKYDRMPVTVVDGAMLFPIADSPVALGLFPYRDAERKFAGGGIWVIVIVEDDEYIVAHTHIFFTTPEKSDPAKLGQGRKFYHLHMMPENIVNEGPNSVERHLDLPHVAHYTELDYAFSQVSTVLDIGKLLCAAGHFDAALAVKQKNLTEAVERARAFYVSAEGIAHAKSNNAPPYWLQRQESIAAGPTVELQSPERVAAE